MSDDDNDDGKVRALLTTAADQMPGGPIMTPPGFAAQAGARRSGVRPWVVAVAAAILVVAAVVVPTWSIGKTTPATVPVTDYGVPTATTYPTSGGATAAALAHGEWDQLPAAPIEGRSWAATVWTGHEMVVLGGLSAGGAALADGGAYEPATRRWRRIAPSPLQARAGTAVVWTGRVMFVWGGFTDSAGQRRALADGAIYDPESDSWRTVAAAPLAARSSVATLWTGGQVLVLGGAPSEARYSFVDGAAYDPATDRWTRLPAIDVGNGKDIHYLRAAATPIAVYAWVFWSHEEPIPEGTSGTGGTVLYRYDPVSGRWSAMSGEQPLDVDASIWTGSELVIPAAAPFRAAGHGPIAFNLAGWRFVPAADETGGRWTRITHGPVDDLRGTSVWTGAALLTIDTHATITTPDGTSIKAGAGAVWDPGTNTWIRLPDAPLTSNEAPSLVWTGSQVLIWGVLGPSDNWAAAGTAGLSFGL